MLCAAGLAAEAEEFGELYYQRASLFDTLGTLYGACAAGNMLTKDGNVPNMDKAMLADAIATCCGAVCAGPGDGRK